DGRWVVFNMLDEAQWVRLCTVLDRPEWASASGYATAKSRFANMATLVPAIDEALATRTRDEWGHLFDQQRLIWGPVLGLHEVATDPQAHALDIFPVIEHAERGEYRTVAAPMRFATANVRPRGPAPDLGADTRSVLSSAGFDDEAIDDLI